MKPISKYLKDPPPILHVYAKPHLHDDVDLEEHYYLRNFTIKKREALTEEQFPYNVVGEVVRNIDGRTGYCISGELDLSDICDVAEPTTDEVFNFFKNLATLIE